MLPINHSYISFSLSMHKLSHMVRVVGYCWLCILDSQCMGWPCSELHCNSMYSKNWRTLQNRQIKHIEWSQVNCSVYIHLMWDSIKNAYHWYFSSMPNLHGGETREQVLNSPLVSSNLALEMFAYFWSLLWSTSALSSLSVPPTTSPTRGTSRSTAETLYIWWWSCGTGS